MSRRPMLLTFLTRRARPARAAVTRPVHVVTGSAMQAEAPQHAVVAIETSRTFCRRVLVIVV